MLTSLHSAFYSCIKWTCGVIKNISMRQILSVGSTVQIFFLVIFGGIFGVVETIVG